MCKGEELLRRRPREVAPPMTVDAKSAPSATTKPLPPSARALASAAPASESKPTRAGYSLTREVVRHHSRPNDAWVTYAGGVYDVTTFLDSHPGGADILHEHLGGDIERVMSDGPHAHSGFARVLLEKHRIGHLVDGDSDATGGNVDASTGSALVDWGKPVLPQVGALGDRYEQWIHSFPTTDHTVKMFPNDFIESLTKCPWYVPLLFWIPVVLLEVAHYLRLIDGLANVPPVGAAFAAVAGFISWLLFEYTLHRFLFHVSTGTYWANIFHFLVHGHHHITPMDFDRLVFPPVPAVIIASPFWIAGPRLIGVTYGYPWLFGLVTGYLVYDMTHYWIHHGVPQNSFLRMQKRRHVFHHYFDPNVNFGISNPLFDYVFGTISEPEKAE